jgi:hypothetical protein
MRVRSVYTDAPLDWRVAQNGAVAAYETMTVPVIPMTSWYLQMYL